MQCSAFVTDELHTSQQSLVRRRISDIAGTAHYDGQTLTCFYPKAEPKKSARARTTIVLPVIADFILNPLSSI